MYTCVGQEKPTILIVDDTPNNVDILVNILSSSYKTKVALNGKRALELCFNDHPPHLILLDIMMPELNGYEVCRKLKENVRTQHIPIIFISAKDEDEDEEMGLELGAVDYITKPVRRAIVRARIKTHIEMSIQRQQLQQAFDELQRLEDLRDSLVHMVVHDMRGALTLLSGHLQILQVKKTDDGQGGRHLSAMSEGCSRLIDMVSTLLDVSRLENGEMPLTLKRHNLQSIAEDCISNYYPLSTSDIKLQEGGEGVEVVCDVAIIERVIANLLGNAIKHSPETDAITISLHKLQSSIRLTVTDSGPGIPPEFHHKIFEKFGQVTTSGLKKHSSGLGLAFCKLAMEAHGGTIGVDSELNNGSSFWIEFPAQPSED